ncbi:NOG1 family protein [Thermococcus sp. GR7]|uniref:NOG1 family protein n=1 Tax=unclassified Thermococcus TaxID=2627626 RepID=UPI001431456C|nr:MULTISPECIES: NOG1 family protein [unclassified Thermococcus]NJE46339.1 NOG1 family protein [Thermococcus sp. GR7]NJE77742.1 NOG1 family protein [Thermococcus sp. GR4]NJF23782.1 NOG1 family protein [Thermococcus sp. GR5]
MKNPFEKMPTVLTADELIDKAFRRAEKAASAFTPKGNRVMKARQREELRVRTVSNVVRDNLRKILDRTPGVSTLPKFYQDLVDTLVDRDQFHRSLAHVNWAIKTIRNLEQRYVEKIRYSREPEEIAKLRRQFYGRVADVIKEIGDDLEYLNQARNVLKDLPVVDLELPTVVIAGHPNVGKSTLLRALTNAKPEVASYPFTTKGINVGQFEEHYLKYQVIDTPGLLDRPLSERNEIERQAILALKHLGRVIVYIFDPSEYCGFPIEEQMHLFEEIYEEFKDFPFIVVLNKMDIADEEKIRQVEEFVKSKGLKPLRISALNGEGLNELKRRVIELVQPMVEEQARKIMENELRKFREEEF